jgi:hypothetical protein
MGRSHATEPLVQQNNCNPQEEKERHRWYRDLNTDKERWLQLGSAIYIISPPGVVYDDFIVDFCKQCRF